MYYEEKLVNGVLYTRSTPTGTWIPVTANELVQMYMELKNQNSRQYLKIQELEEKLNEIVERHTS